MRYEYFRIICTITDYPIRNIVKKPMNYTAYRAIQSPIIISKADTSLFPTPLKRIRHENYIKFLL